MTLDLLYVWKAGKAARASKACVEAAERAGFNVYRTEVQDGIKGQYDYWHAMNEAFRRGRPFLNLEHDNVLTLKQIQEIGRCPEPICAFAYPMRSVRGSCRNVLALGATKFSAEIIETAVPALRTFKPVPYEHVVTPVFVACTVQGPQRFHQHMPNAVHVGHTWPDRTGLPPHIDPEAMQEHPVTGFLHKCVNGHPCFGAGTAGHGCNLEGDGLFYHHWDEGRKHIDTNSKMYLDMVRQRLVERINQVSRRRRVAA